LDVRECGVTAVYVRSSDGRLVAGRQVVAAGADHDENRCGAGEQAEADAGKDLPGQDVN
jgi:hypothetical protein